MEEDLLKTSNWIPCIENQYKSKHLPGAWKEKEYVSNPEDYIEQYEEAKSELYKTEAEDLISRHFSLLDKKNAPDIKKKKSKKGGKWLSGKKKESTVGVTGRSTGRSTGSSTGGSIESRRTGKRRKKKTSTKKEKKISKKKTSTKKTKRRKR